MAGEVWVVLGSPSLYPWAALATVRPHCCRRVTLGAGRQPVLSLTVQQDGMGHVRYERGFNYKYAAQLDGHNV